MEKAIKNLSQKHHSAKFKTSLFEILLAFWLFIVFFSLLIALAGVFYLSLIFSLIIIFGGVSFVFLKKEGIGLKKHSKDEYFVFLLIFIWAIFLSWGTFPTIFGGRDEGSFSNAAILLFHNHSLFHQDQLIKDFFDIYGPGKALNFPGFFYTYSGELRSQFLPGYIAYLALLFGWGGLKFLSFSNFIPLIFFLFVFYLLSKKLFSLFFKKLLLKKKKKRRKNHIIIDDAILFIPFILLAPTLVYLFDANISLDHPWMLRRFVFSILPFSILASFLILNFLLALVLFWFQKEKTDQKIQKQIEFFVQSCSFLALLLLASSFPLVLFSRFTLSEIFFAALLLSLVYFSFQYFLKKQTLYLLFIFLLLLILSFVRVESLAIIFVLAFLFLILDSQNFQKTSFQFFVVWIGFFVVLSLVFNSNFFIDSFKNFLNIENYFSDNFAKDSSFAKDSFNFNFISDDWQEGYLWKVLANYNLLELILAGFLGLILLFWIFRREWQLEQFSQKNSKLIGSVAFLWVVVFLGGIIFLVFSNGKLLKSIFFQNQKLWEDIKLLSEKFASDDLILISRESSGSGWSLIAEPIRNILKKQAVYFFNSNDLKKINLDHYDRIFLISSTNEKDLFEKIPKKEIEKYQLENISIQSTRIPWEKPKVKRIITEGVIYEVFK